MLRGSKSSANLVLLACGLSGACRSSVTDADDGDRRIVWVAPSVRAILGAGGVSADAERAYVSQAPDRFVAVSLNDGRLLWSAQSDEGSGSELAMRSGSVCAGRVVFGSRLAMYAVDPASGRRVWRWQGSNGGSLYNGAPSCVGGNLIVTTSNPMRVYAIDANTGQERWISEVIEFGTPNGVLASPVVLDDVVVVCSRVFPAPFRGSVRGFDLLTGREVWRHTWTAAAPRTDASCALPPAVGDGLAIASVDDGRLFAIALRSGVVRWTAPAVAENTSPRDERPVAVTGNVVMAGSLSGFLVGMDLASGREVWRASEPDRSATSVIDPFSARDGAFFAVNQSGWVLSVDAATGSLRWIVKRKSGLNERVFHGQGAIATSRCIFAASDGVYALAR
jgi:outer membrane protein assembly factor BamB